MVKTHGLTHISLAVRDPERSLRFYRQVFGVREYDRDENSIQVQGPGPHDVIAFEKKAKTAGARGGIEHFGFRLVRPEDIDAAVNEVERARQAPVSRRVRPRVAVRLRARSRRL